MINNQNLFLWRDKVQISDKADQPNKRDYKLNLTPKRELIIEIIEILKTTKTMNYTTIISKI